MRVGLKSLLVTQKDGKVGYKEPQCQTEEDKHFSVESGDHWKVAEL